VLSTYEKLEQIRIESGPTKTFALEQFATYSGSINGVDGLPYDSSLPIHATHVIREVLRYDSEIEADTLQQIYQRIAPTNASTNSFNSKNPKTSRIQTRKVDDDLTDLAKDIAADLSILFNRSLASGVEILIIQDSTELGQKKR